MCGLFILCIYCAIVQVYLVNTDHFIGVHQISKIVSTFGLQMFKQMFCFNSIKYYLV